MIFSSYYFVSIYDKLVKFLTMHILRNTLFIIQVQSNNRNHFHFFTIIIINNNQ